MKKTRAKKPFALPDEEILEVLDIEQRPLLLMPSKYALQQKLPLKSVLVAVRNRERKIYICQRLQKKQSPSTSWNISAAGYVRAGESFEDAALRKLAEEFAITSLNVKLAAMKLPDPSAANSHAALFLSTPAQVMIQPNPAEIAHGLFVDQDELNALIRYMPELLSPALKWAAEACDLFQP